MPVATGKNDQILRRRRVRAGEGRGEIEFFLHLHRLTRIARVVHRADGNIFVRVVVGVEQFLDVRVKIVPVAGVVIQRHLHAVGQRTQTSSACARTISRASANSNKTGGKISRRDNSPCPATASTSTVRTTTSKPICHRLAGEKLGLDLGWRSCYFQRRLSTTRRVRNKKTNVALT